MYLIVDGQPGASKYKLDDSGKLTLEFQGPARRAYVYLADDPGSFVSINVVELISR